MGDAVEQAILQFITAGAIEAQNAANRVAVDLTSAERAGASAEGASRAAGAAARSAAAAAQDLERRVSRILANSSRIASTLSAAQGIVEDFTGDRDNGFSRGARVVTKGASSAVAFGQIGGLIAPGVGTAVGAAAGFAFGAGGELVSQGREDEAKAKRQAELIAAALARHRENDLREDVRRSRAMESLLGQMSGVRGDL